MKISLGSWAFSFGSYARNPIPFRDIVHRLADAGYDGIEICGFDPQVSPECYPSKSARRELAEFIADQGLGISGFDPDLSQVNPTIAGNRDRYLDLFRSNLELAVDLECPSMRVDSGAAPGSIDEPLCESAFHHVASVWRDCATIAEGAGVRVVWEFEPGFVFNRPHEIIRMHQEVRHPNFSILFDTAHAYMCGVVGARQQGNRDVVDGGIAGFLDMLHGRIGAVHIIDSDGTLHEDETSTHRPFGEGLIDFPALAPRMLALPGIDWWTVDLSFWPDAWKLIDPSLAFVRNLTRLKP